MNNGLIEKVLIRIVVRYPNFGFILPFWVHFCHFVCIVNTICGLLVVCMVSALIALEMNGVFIANASDEVVQFCKAFVEGIQSVGLLDFTVVSYEEVAKIIISNFSVILWCIFFAGSLLVTWAQFEQDRQNFFLQLDDAHEKRRTLKTVQTSFENK